MTAHEPEYCDRCGARLVGAFSQSGPEARICPRGDAHAKERWAEIVDKALARAHEAADRVDAALDRMLDASLVNK